MFRSTTRAGAAPFPRLREAIGVTRVARVTRLDRAGVEVACAIRPQGHVLQVSNGKGETFAEAARGAVLEAAELWASEHPPPGEGPLALVAATDLLSGEEVLLPARAVFCPAPGARPVSGPEARWTSNGMGAHPDRDAALLHALLEAVERHQLTRSLPRLWTRGAVARRMIDRRTLAREAPRAARLARRIEAGGFEVFLFDLGEDEGRGEGSGRDRGRGRNRGRIRGRGLGVVGQLPRAVAAPPPSRSYLGRRQGRRPRMVAVAGALLFDRERGAVPLTAGYACALGPDQALRGALLEAAQSRLTDIHGAREDVEPMDPDAAALLRAFCEGVRPARRASGMARLRARSPRAAVAAVLRRLRAAGVRRVAAAELAPRGLGVQVVKVVIPGFRLSELL